MVLKHLHRCEISVRTKKCLLCLIFSLVFFTQKTPIWTKKPQKSHLKNFSCPSNFGTTHEEKRNQGRLARGTHKIALLVREEWNCKDWILFLIFCQSVCWPACKAVAMCTSHVMLPSEVDLKKEVFFKNNSLNSYGISSGEEYREIQEA